MFSFMFGCVQTFINNEYTEWDAVLKVSFENFEKFNFKI